MKISWFAGICLAAALAGCASKASLGPSFHAGDEQMPEFLNGPAVVLLTNAGGFSARLDTDIPRPYANGKTVGGVLLQRQGRLVFQPDQPKDKKRPGAGLIFIWDANLRRGWTASEALQGYAPVALPLELTNIQAAAPVAAEPIDGHPCHRVEVTVSRSDGSTASYRVWQADDLRHFPLKIESFAGGRPVTLRLSDVRLDSPPESLFNPPDGFVKYDSPVAMMNELIIRETTIGEHSGATEFMNGPVAPRGGTIYTPDPGR